MTFLVWHTTHSAKLDLSVQGCFSLSQHSWNDPSLLTPRLWDPLSTRVCPSKSSWEDKGCLRLLTPVSEDSASEEPCLCSASVDRSFELPKALLSDFSFMEASLKDAPEACLSPTHPVSFDDMSLLDPICLCLAPSQWGVTLAPWSLPLPSLQEEAPLSGHWSSEAELTNRGYKGKRIAWKYFFMQFGIHKGDLITIRGHSNIILHLRKGWRVLASVWKVYEKCGGLLHLYSVDGGKNCSLIENNSSKREVSTFTNIIFFLDWGIFDMDNFHGHALEYVCM